ncbi:hypothetical protein, partial [Enterococcus faecium]|uniref:hypothetical protein n=1 Tax=Enterococcus faecium TaxID=1352 RepID=UPI001C8C3782
LSIGSLRDLFFNKSTANNRIFSACVDIQSFSILQNIYKLSIYQFQLNLNYYNKNQINYKALKLIWD